MFSDFQEYFWLVFSEPTQAVIFFMIIGVTTVLIAVIWDLSVAILTEKGGD